MSEEIHAEKRMKLGSRNSMKLRRTGKLPAVLYGHGEESVSLALPADEFAATLRHGAKVVDLSGDVSGQALLQEVQWDTFFHQVLHVDLLRVKAGEMITISVPVELRGVAPGVNEGGYVDHLVHEIEINVTPANAPERLHLNINSLGLDGSMTAAEIEDMPEGASFATDETTVIVQCIERAEAPDEDEFDVGGAEPEVIGQKDDGEGDKESGE